MYVYHNQSCNTWMLDLLTSSNLPSPVKSKHVNFIRAARPTWHYTFTQGLVMSLCLLVLLSWYSQHVQNHVLLICLWPTTKLERKYYFQYSWFDREDLNCVSSIFETPNCHPRTSSNNSNFFVSSQLSSTLALNHTKKNILGHHITYSSTNHHITHHITQCPPTFDDISHHRFWNEACKGLDTHREATKPPVIWTDLAWNTHSFAVHGTGMGKSTHGV